MPALLHLLLVAFSMPVFSEIQAKPATGVPEWVELLDQGARDLSGWTLDDGTTAHALPDGTSIPAAGILVLSSNCTTLLAAWGNAAIPCAKPDGWNALSVDSDAVVLRDASGSKADSVRWSAKTWGTWPANRSRERISSFAPSSDPASWRASTVEGGTPGWIPAAVSPGFAALSVAPQSKVATPGKENAIDLSAPSGAKVALDLYDLSRRHLATLWNAAAPPEGTFSWDGRVDGRNLSPGIYMLLARCGADSRRTWIAVGKP